MLKCRANLGRIIQRQCRYAGKPSSGREHRNCEAFRRRSEKRALRALSEQPSFQTDFDAIIILGGGLAPGGDLPEWVKRRVKLGKKLFDVQDSRHCWLLCVGAGTPHKPVVVKGQHAYHEATACADYLIAQGVPAKRILKETSSFDTVGNGYFAAAVHAIPAEWRKCAVVTSAFHMLRTEAIFRTCFALAGKSLHGDEEFIKLSFFPASDDGIFEADILLARQSKERESHQEWLTNAAQLQSLQDLHTWLHSTHLCYAVERQSEFGDAREQDHVKATY